MNFNKIIGQITNLCNIILLRNQKINSWHITFGTVNSNNKCNGWPTTVALNVKHF